MLAQEREELFLVMTAQRIVVALVDGGFDVALGFADGEVLFHLRGTIVANTQLYIKS